MHESNNYPFDYLFFKYLLYICTKFLKQYELKIFDNIYYDKHKEKRKIS